METSRERFLILDANVIIDFYKSDKTLLKLISSHVGQIYLATNVLKEIKELDESECYQLGIKLIEPDLSQVIEASKKRGKLSLQDHICLILAREYGLTCVTNDKPLRQECKSERIPLIWGIELICILVESGGLNAIDAKDIILRIQKNNPTHIKEDIVRKAFERLGLSEYTD
jgi:rRNA-processing protein FCF1